MPKQNLALIEIFLDRRDGQVRIAWPRGSQRRSAARELLAPFFTDTNRLAGEPLDALPAVQRAVNAARAATLEHFRADGLTADNKRDTHFDPVTIADRAAERKHIVGKQ